MKPVNKWSVLGFTAAIAACASVASTPAAPTYEVSAIKYGTLAGFRTSGLIAGVDTARRTDAALTIWLVRSAERTVLMDAGFYRDKFMRQWKPVNYERPSEAIARAGIKPGDVTDIIISHIHWDHADGADLFPNARVWIQREEYDHYIDSTGRAKSSTIDSLDAAMLFRIAKGGRVRLVDGDSVEIMPGIRVFTGGKHTFASQFAAVRTSEGTVVLASDNAYLYENLDSRRPIAQTLDSMSNLRAQDRMKRLATSAKYVVPGHDPSVFVRFPEPGNGVARIR